MSRQYKQPADRNGLVQAVPWAREQQSLSRTHDWMPACSGICYLICYISLALGAARIISGYHSWNFQWLPENLVKISTVMFLFFNVTVGPLLVLMCDVVCQIKRLICNEHHLQLKSFLKEYLSKYIRYYLLKGTASYILVYCTLIAYTNIKPTIPLLNSTIYDDVLFRYDNKLFELISFGGLLTIHKNPTITNLFDVIYFMLWPLACLTLLISCRHGVLYWRYTSAWCIALGLSLPISVIFPTMGPAFFRPELYSHISGTHTAIAMEGLLTHYHSFTMDPMRTPIISANGIVGMPSLHVALCYLSSLVIGEIFPMLRYVAWGLTLLFVVVTVYLGWHYLLDGVGGIALGWIAYRISMLWFVGESEIPHETKSGCS